MIKNQFNLDQDEVLLSGTRNTELVTKKGNTVIRTTCPNSPFVHKVLLHLQNKNSDIAPRFLGLTKDGREILTFIGGACKPFGTKLSNSQYYDIGKLIKALHNSLIDFQGCKDNEVVCHNDITPCNIVFINECPTAMIDFDKACIDDPLVDVAYAICMCCDIGFQNVQISDIGAKISSLIDGYHLNKIQRKQLVFKMQEVAHKNMIKHSQKQEQGAYEWGITCYHKLINKDNMKILNDYICK